MDVGSGDFLLRLSKIVSGIDGILPDSRWRKRKRFLILKRLLQPFLLSQG
jgi:hypothetical protein